jgi:YidC/Oxa1 family membrane protein insertase
MDSGKSVLRWLGIGLVVFLVMQFGSKFFGGGHSGSTSLQPLKAEGTEIREPRQKEQLCSLWTESFRADLSSQGASLKHFALLPAKYRKSGKSIDLSTTPDVELRRQLRINLRNEAVASPKDPSWQLDYDTVDWTLTESTAKRCVFEYSDEKAHVVKSVTTTERPYELSLALKVVNRSSSKLRHALTIDTTAWRLQTEVKGGMFRVSPLLTHVECIPRDGKATRLRPEDFEPDDFKAPPFAVSAVNPGDFYQVPGTVDVAAVSNAYFSHAIVPEMAPKGVAPLCQLQIEERWNGLTFKSAGDDPNAGAMYRARLAYPAVTLEPQQTAEYGFLSYIGPKERKVLAAAGGGKTSLGELIDLGFFSVIAKVLVGFLLKVHSIIPNWGIAIIILTITARTLLFPLTLPSVKSMIKMRELKPEMDAMNEKFKDDPQGKGLAQMELWRKHKVNPLKGCLPQLASMPVWFALYTTLQTAVELFNIPFLWFPDLSQPDPYFVLPFVIGATSFIQQKMMPMQGDPAQQKMMLYMMPGMFTVFMLFLPSGLGVYMFTNGVLGILQQQLVERHARKVAAATKELNVTTKATGAEGGTSQRSSSAKGKAR